MKHATERAIGSGLTVPLLGFGGGALNQPSHEFSIPSAREAIDAAWRSGIRYFDTAPLYAYGLSERLIGDSLRERGETAVLSTKVGRLLRPGLPPEAGEQPIRRVPFGLRFDYSREGTLRAFEDSLQRIGVDRIDIVLVHDIDVVTHGEQQPTRFREAIEGALPTLLDLKRQGAIGAVGLGVNEWEVCAEALYHVELDCVLIAGRYTLLETDVLDEFLPLCRSRSVGIIVGGPFNSGVLAAPRTKNTFDYRPTPSSVADRVGKMLAVCEAFGVALPAAALQFPTAEASVVSIIPGAHSAAEIEQNVTLFNQHIPSAFWDALKAEGLLRADAPVPS